MGGNKKDPATCQAALKTGISETVAKKHNVTQANATEQIKCIVVEAFVSFDDQQYA